MLAYALIVLGVIFLLKNLGLLVAVNWDLVWPIALIILGVIMIYKKKL